MKFSIVIPTYNEEKDIEETLLSLISQKYGDKEIIIVDDSSDDTPTIVKKYADQEVRLIHPGGGGRCEARNIGIEQANGEIVCILNADVRPRKDYLSRIARHYENGADYVLVGAEVSNTENLYARYIESSARQNYNEDTEEKSIEWTEGFSCRKEIAKRAGMFPTGFIVPICAGEDGYFGAGLRATGAKKIIDLDIVVDHVAPSTFKEYWNIRKGRGMGSSQCHHLLEKWSLARTSLWAIAKTVKSFFEYVTIFIPMYRVLRITMKSPKGIGDFFGFYYANMVETVAFHVGEWEAIGQIKRRGRHVAN